MNRFKTVLLTTVVCCFTLPSFAAVTDQANVDLYAPWTAFQGVLQNFVKSVSNYRDVSVPDQNWSIDNISWHIQGIKLNSNVSLSQGTLNSSTYKINANHLAIKIGIKKVWVDQTIQQVINGIVFRIHLKGSCGPISLSEMNARGSLVFNYKLLPTAIQANLSSLQLKWPASSWKIAPITCQGPKGFSTTITTALQKQLNDPSAVQNFVKQKLSDELASGVAAINKNVGVKVPIQLPDNRLPMTFEVKHFQNIKSGILITNVVSWPGLNTVHMASPLPLSGINLAAVQEPVVLTKEQDWSSLLGSELEALPDIAFDLSKVSPFKKLLGSSFEEFFVWPDLENYHSYSPFTLTMSQPHLDNLTWKYDGSFNATIEDTGWIESLRDKQEWNYVDLGAVANFNCVPQIYDGQLTMPVVISQGQLHHLFGQKYLGHYNTDTYINDDVIAGSIEKWSKPYSVKQKLSTFHLGIFGSAKLNGWVPLKNSLISIPLKVSL